MSVFEADTASQGPTSAGKYSIEFGLARCG